MYIRVVEVVIECDWCGKASVEFAEDLDPGEAKRRAVKMGWRIRPNWLIDCPDCKAKAIAREKEDPNWSAPLPDRPPPEYVLKKVKPKKGELGNLRIVK
jgi:hypothetical protein